MLFQLRAIVLCFDVLFFAVLLVVAVFAELLLPGAAFAAVLACAAVELDAALDVLRRCLVEEL